MRQRLTRYALVACVVVVLGAFLFTLPAHAQGGFASPPVFNADGQSIAVFSGGSVGDLEAAAASVSGTGVWAQDEGGSFHLLVVNGPTFLRATFVARFPSGFGVIAVTVIRSPGTSSTPGPMEVLRTLVVAIPHRTAPAYERDAWPHWIDADRDCQDTRQEVLIAESIVAVTFATLDACRVAAGLWLDAYTGATFTDPGGLDVDHLVPLEDAHISGGWAWTLDQRRAFANDLTPEHLIAVSASANRSKGSRSPDEWRPARAEYWCTYATGWVSVKSRWSLSVTVTEQGALQAMLANCPADAVP